MRIDPLFQAVDPAPTSGALVSFDAGARTAWHTHPLGQTLLILSGLTISPRSRFVRPGGRVLFRFASAEDRELSAQVHWMRAPPVARR